MKPIRIYHVVISWIHRKQKYEQEIVITAPDKESAKEKAKNRVPIEILKNDNTEDTVKITVHDLGTPENHKTYYASKPQISAKNKSPLSLEHQMALTFAILWGHETGYRAGNPYVSPVEQDQLKKLAEQENKEQHIYDMAVRYLTDNKKDPKEFFKQELSDLFGEILLNIEQMTPPIDMDELESAEERSRQIIEQAKAQSLKILNETQDKTNEQLRLLEDITNNLSNIKTPEPVISATEFTEYQEFNDLENLEFNEDDETQEQTMPEDTEDTRPPNKNSDDQRPSDDPPEQPADEIIPDPDGSRPTETKNTEPPKPDTKPKIPVYKKPEIKLDLTNIDDPTPIEERYMIREADVTEETLLKILKPHTLTQQKIEVPALRAFERLKQDKSKSEKEWLFTLLSIVNPVNGKEGWDRLCAAYRRQYPNCIFDFRIPVNNDYKAQTAKK